MVILDDGIRICSLKNTTEMLGLDRWEGSRCPAELLGQRVDVIAIDVDICQESNQFTFF